MESLTINVYKLQILILHNKVTIILILINTVIHVLKCTFLNL